MIGLHALAEFLYNRSMCFRRHLVGLLICGHLIQLTASAGDTYYVATGGNNISSGLAKTNAWATLQHAADQVAAGDTVIVCAGTYVGARIETSGTPSEPICFRAEPGARVTLNTPSPSNKRNAVLEVETFNGNSVISHVVIDGFNIENSPSHGIRAQSAQFITLRGNSVSNSGSTTM
jgi:hypothetical protein